MAFCSVLQWYKEVSAHLPYKALGFLGAVSVELFRGCIFVVNSREVSRKASSSHPNLGLDICSPSMEGVWTIGLASLPLPYAPNGLALTQDISKHLQMLPATSFPTSSLLLFPAVLSLFPCPNVAGICGNSSNNLPGNTRGTEQGLSVADALEVPLGDR